MTEKNIKFVCEGEQSALMVTPIGCEFSDCSAPTERLVCVDGGVLQSWSQLCTQHADELVANFCNTDYKVKVYKAVN